MNQISVSLLIDGMKFEGFLLVRESEQKITQAGLNYLNLNLADKTGEINAKVWDINAIPPNVGSVIKVKGSIINYNGKLQFKVERFRSANSDDIIDMSLLAPVAPSSSDDMLLEIKNTISDFKSSDLKLLISSLLDKYSSKLEYYPAAQRIHHAERSGLLHHITDMLKISFSLKTIYPWLDWDLINAGIIIHDICKVEELNSNELGIVKEYTKDGLLIGHIIRGITEIENLSKSLEINGEIVLLLQHMLLSHHGEPEFGSPRRPMFAEAEMLHWIDTIDARMNQFFNDTEKLLPGTFSEKIWSLDRRLYRPNFDEIYNKNNYTV